MTNLANMAAFGLWGFQDAPMGSALAGLQTIWQGAQDAVGRARAAVETLRANKHLTPEGIKAHMGDTVNAELIVLSRLEGALASPRQSLADLRAKLSITPDVVSDVVAAEIRAHYRSIKDAANRRNFLIEAATMGDVATVSALCLGPPALVKALQVLADDNREALAILAEKKDPAAAAQANQLADALARATQAVSTAIAMVREIGGLPRVDPIADMARTGTAA